MINWEIRELNVKTGTDVVMSIHWTVSASEGDHYYSFDGVVFVPEPLPDTNFIPFAELTKDQVIEWVKAELGERLPEITNHVLLGLADMKNTPHVPKPLPW